MYFAYILKSIKDNKYYYGSTADVEKRLAKHNKGDVRTTKGRRPFLIHHVEEFNTRSERFRREQFYKSVNGYIWLKENNIT